jgi:hypothetical protein
LQDLKTDGEYPSEQVMLGGNEAVATHMTQPEISSVSPFFIVRDAAAALSFYRDQLRI